MKSMGEEMNYSINLLEKVRLGSYLIYSRINPMWIKVLNVKWKQKYI